MGVRATCILLKGTRGCVDAGAIMPKGTRGCVGAGAILPKVAKATRSLLLFYPVLHMPAWGHVLAELGLG